MGDLGIGEKIILKWTLKIQNMTVAMNRVQDGCSWAWSDKHFRSQKPLQVCYETDILKTLTGLCYVIQPWKLL